MPEGGAAHLQLPSHTLTVPSPHSSKPKPTLSLCFEESLEQTSSSRMELLASFSVSKGNFAPPEMWVS